MSDTNTSTDFVRELIREHRRTNRFGGRVHTRFPPEPNGYLHIGHAKSIALNFGVAADFGGLCNLRFDDTNPTKESTEIVDAIKRDVRWLGFDWDDRLYYASDYFEKLYNFAVQLVKMGKAYVCDLSQEEAKKYRGTTTEPGRPSPYRDRSVEENLDLFERMRKGEFPDGARVLRAKIDMSSPNFLMRDPVIYRILHATHHRTGDAWCIYPMYDFTHCLSDSLEGITNSICTLEFENNRELYDWYLDTLGVYHPQQTEFARLALTYTVMSKRILKQLVEQGLVRGWDDPRMPTLSGMRRRGYTPEAIRYFCEAIGVAKTNSTVEVELLEHHLRQDLNSHAPRVMGVLKPLRLVIDNYPQGQVEWMDAENNPEDPAAGSRQIPFSSELFVEQDDFQEEAPKKWFRLSPGKEVRLKHAYYVTCVSAVKDASGQVVELHCTYDPESRGGWTKDGREVKGTLHWVSAAHAIPAEVRLYERLFTVPDPLDHEEPFASFLNPNSEAVLTGCLVEPGLANAAPGTGVQFLRQGYFCVDPDSTAGKLVFNRTVSLRDTWAKMASSAARA